MSTSSAPAGGPDVISDPPVVMTVWAWPKRPFGNNSGMGCHDATALRSFPDGNLNIETDIRWESTARREPGTVFGVLKHHANTNQENFGVGRRYYLPSAEDVSQVACLNLINTPNPENPNWLAIKVRLTEKGRTELATLTPPEILAMLRTPATVLAPPNGTEMSVGRKLNPDVSGKDSGINTAIPEPSDDSTQPVSPGELLDDTGTPTGTRKPEGVTPPTDAYTKLRQFAREDLKGQERAVVEALCDADGELQIADLAVKDGVGWDDPFEGFKNAQKRLNPKLKRIGCTLTRQNNAAKLNRNRG